MKLKHLFVAGLIGVVLLSVFTACNGGIFGQNGVSLWAAGIERGDGGKITGFKCRVNNEGDAVSGAGFEINLTTNTADNLAGKLYKGRIDIPSGESDITISWDNHVVPYLAENPPNQPYTGYYRVAFQYDPDKETNNSRSDGQAVTPDEFWIVNGMPAAYSATTYITTDPSSQVSYYDGSAPWPVVDGGAFPIYIGFVPTDFAFASLAQTNSPASLFEDGWLSSEMPFDSSNVSTSSFRCGAPARASYLLFAFIDANKNGTFDLDSSRNALEPYGVFGSTNGKFPGSVVSVNDELYGLTIVLTDDEPPA